MTEYFATCDIQAPISVSIMANSLEEVLEQIEANGQQWTDDFRCDAEDAFIDMEFDDDWNDYSPEDIANEMARAGYQIIHDSVIGDCWVVWQEI